MIEVLESDYVEMARLKGLSERTVLMRHALPNALGPTFQVIAINLAYLAGGVIVVEYIFNYAGIGGALGDGVANHDIPVVQALAMLIAAVYVVLNLLADIATILVTPRLQDTPVSAIADTGILAMPEVAAGAPADVAAAAQRARALAHAHRARSSWARSSRVAVFGPYLAPHTPTAFVGQPNTQPSNLLFGTDHIGQDVWSRFLSGGGQILAVSAIATILGLVLGVVVGPGLRLLAQLARRRAHAHHGRDPGVPADHAGARRDHDAGREGLADRARGRPDDDAARRARHPRRRAARGRARLRGRGRGARRRPLAHPARARSCPTSSRR